MGLIQNIDKLLKFDRENTGFELLEREEGTPEVFGKWSDTLHEDKSKFRRIPPSIDETERYLREQFSADVNKDLILRRIVVCGEIGALVVYMNGMADDAKINDFILRPLMQLEVNALDQLTDAEDGACDLLLRSVIQISEASIEKDAGAVNDGIMDGMTALFIDGENECILLDTHGFEKRSIGAAENEKVVFGPKESFTESLRTNITLIRRLIHTEDLVVELKSSGGENNTRLALIYREGRTDPALVAEVKRRLAQVSTKSVLGSGTVEQMIEDRSFLPIPQTLSTERPDRASSHILSGCVCIITEGSPLATVLPVTLFSLMSSPEDIYMRKPLGNLLRFVRYAGALISIVLPGYFLALAMYHQGSLTTEVLSTVIASRRMVFEPIAVEMILLLLVFQLIREAGLRVPGSIGQAIGIIGGLIMGQAAVAANLASTVVLIIVALSGLGNFCIPDYSTQIAAAYFRMALVLAAWLGGMLAMAAALQLGAALIASKKSFGVPFLAPFAPKTASKRPTILRGDIGGSTRAEDQFNTSDDLRTV